jgi:YD repeat-containing protein
VAQGIRCSLPLTRVLAALLFRVLAVLLLTAGVAGCPSKPPEPEQAPSVEPASADAGPKPLRWIFKKSEPLLAADAAPPHLESPTIAPADVPVPEDTWRDVELTWSTSLGEGGALVPRLGDAGQPEQADDWFTRLKGAHFPAGGEEILFFGVSEPGHQPLDPDQLLDAFVVAYRAVSEGHAPGVSIDPTPEQLARGLNDNDQMNVVYSGGVRGTEFGLVNFEADRKLKCLSFGMDNVTKLPFRVDIPGYQTELELAVRHRQGRQQSWHRFWFRQLVNRVAQSSDGRTLFVYTKLEVDTEYMVAKNGRLESGGQPADPAARQFSAHLTDNYDAYALKIPVLDKLLAYASLTAIAEAVLPPEEDASDKDRPRPGLAPVWLLDEYPSKPIETPETTPALVASREDKVTPTTMRVLRAAGGVNLTPKNRYRHPASDADLLQNELLAAGQLRSKLRTYRFNFNNRPYRAASARPGRAVSLWQEDCRLEDFPLVRDWRPGNPHSEFGNGWSLRVPRLTVSEETAEYAGIGTAPRMVSLRGGPEDLVKLTRFATLTMPGQPSTPGYVTRDGSCRLFRYKNVWVVVQGQVDYLSDAQGAVTTRLQPGARVINFSPDAGHEVQSIRTSTGVVEFEHEGQRLSRIADARGKSVRLEYDEDGRCSKLTADDGRILRYSYDAEGNLQHVTDNQGRWLTYIYNGKGVPTGFQGDISSASYPGYQTTAQFAMYDNGRPARASAMGQEASRGDAAHLELRPAAGQGRDYALHLDGKPVPLEGTIEAVIENAVMYDNLEPAKSLAGLLSSQMLAGRKKIVVSGKWDKAADLATVVNRAAPDLNVFTATNPELAARNLRASGLSGKPARVLIFKEGLDAGVRDDLRGLARESRDADTVLVVGHNTAEFVEQLTEAGNSGAFRGKNVLLLTCGSQQLSGLVPNILENWRATSVMGFRDPVDQRLLPLLVKGIQQQLSARPRSTGGEEQIRGDQRIESLLQKVIDGILEQLKARELPSAIQEEDIQMLRLLYEQLGMDTSLDPRVVKICQLS